MGLRALAPATRAAVRMSSVAQPDVSRFVTQPRPDATKDYIMQQTMIRVKDPEASLQFYCNVLGFNLVMYREFPQWSFNGDAPPAAQRTLAPTHARRVCHSARPPVQSTLWPRSIHR
jgi:hypothetical protein